MRVVLLYVVVTNGPRTEDYCSRFVATYREYPPGIEHETIVICQGGPLPTSATVLFSGINAAMWPHPNAPGLDILAYIDAARGPCKDADMVLCCGETVYFHRAGWLQRLIEAWKRYGPGMYGPFASNLVRPHLNTTAFLTAPSLLTTCPRSPIDRYAWEHGEHSFWRWVESQGLATRLVTWDGEYDPRGWRVPRDILWRGNQTNCLLWCNHTDRWIQADARLKYTWSRGADQPYQ